MLYLPQSVGQVLFELLVYSKCHWINQNIPNQVYVGQFEQLGIESQFGLERFIIMGHHSGSRLSRIFGYLSCPHLSHIGH